MGSAEKYTYDSISSTEDRQRRKREGVLIVVIIAVIALLTYAENRVIHFGTEFPISNTILMFILININLLLLILLLFLVFRNIVKLLYDRKRKVIGARLRTKLVAAFIALTLLPTIVLFIISINFITNSIEFWFNIPIEQALENSLQVGQRFYRLAEENHRFFIERIAYQIKVKRLQAPSKAKALAHYIQIVQREFNLDAVEVYASKTERLTYAVVPEMENLPLTRVTADNLLKTPEKNAIRSISEAFADGELLRTIGTVPFGIDPEEADAFIVLSIFIPPDLADNMAAIATGFEEYQQIKLLKKPIQVTYYITLSIVGLLVVFCAVWFGFYLAKSITIPILELAEGTRRVAEGDLNFSIRLPEDDEIGMLVNAFNQMTKDLRSSRQQLEHSARRLHAQNVEIEERRQYMEIVLRNISAGVISVDAEGCVSTINKSAEKMLQIRSHEIINKSYRFLLSGEHLVMADEIMQNLLQSDGDMGERPLRLTVKGEPRSFLMHFNALQNDIGQHLGVVMVFDDLTELEKAQRMAAWREVARRIAHEVKNPLTPIKLSAQRLNRKYVDTIEDPVFEECTRIIIDHVDLIRNLVNEFSAFARFPNPNPKPCRLPPIIEETIALYREAHPHIAFDFCCNAEIPVLNLDRQQMKQALINLVDNAISSVRGHGRIAISIQHDAALNRVRLEIADDGPGISDADKTRLFEPYFSTKKAGMGLGLTIVSSIIADHYGKIRVQNNTPRGARFIIELPV